jgi:hypothetical protein
VALYAQATTVPVHRSRAEIEGLLVKHKASQYLTAHDSERGQAVVQFKIQNRIVRFVVKLPLLTDYAKRRDRRGLILGDAQKEALRAQDERQRWRALLLVIKAKLECVENGIATFEEEFLAHIVLPDDTTVGQVILPRIQAAYDGGKLLLTEGSNRG